MTDKFKNKYKIKSARLGGYDYSQNGMYFITICTKDHKEFFGDVMDGEMVLNDAGEIIDQLWREIPKHFQFVRLNIYQVMPNHIHGNLEIIQKNNVEARFIATQKDAMNRVSTVDGELFEKLEGVSDNNPNVKSKFFVKDCSLV